MGTVDTENPNPATRDQLAERRTAQSAGRARPARPRPPKQPAPLIDAPNGNEALLDMEASVVTPASYRSERPAEPSSVLDEAAGDTGAQALPESSSSRGPSQTAEEFVAELDKTAPTAGSPAAPSQSDNELIEELQEIEQASRADTVTHSVTGTAQLPANTPTSRPPRRARNPRAPRAARAPRFSRMRARKTGLALIVVLMLIGGAVVLAVQPSSPPAQAASAGTRTPSTFDAAATKAVDPFSAFKLLAATVAATVEKQPAHVHARARRPPRRNRRHEQHARAIKHTHAGVRSTPSASTAPQIQPVTTAPSSPSPTATGNTYQAPASTPAPSQPAGPTSPGSAGSNCNPQCK